jgi:hypothetical protein
MKKNFWGSLKNNNNKNERLYNFMKTLGAWLSNEKGLRKKKVKKN